MNAKEIRESGMLELYAMGALSEQEARQVERYLEEFPELQKDYFDIQVSLQALAKEQGVKPRAGLEDAIVKSVMDEPSSPDMESTKKTAKPDSNAFNGWKLLSILFAVSTLAMGYLIWTSNQKFNDLQQEYTMYQEDCDSLTQSQQQSLELYEQLNKKENRVLNITPTAGYPETQLLFHINTVEQQNFIQVQNLPGIASNQAFQLWSLKPGVDPIPLTVFKQGNEFIIPVDFEEGTGTYAITIEDEAGAQVPTLERLIGTVTV